MLRDMGIYTWKYKLVLQSHRVYRRMQQSSKMILWVLLCIVLIFGLLEVTNINFNGRYYDWVSFDDSLQTSRLAYATAVVGDAYVPGVLALICSIREHDPSVRTGGTAILVLYDDISQNKLAEVRALGGVRLVDASYIKTRLGTAKNNLRKGCFYKLDVWNMVQYNKIVWIDSDIIVARDPTRLFKFAGDFGVVGHRNTDTEQKFNSGVMVLRPDKEVARRLWEIVDTGSFERRFDFTSGDAFVEQDVVNQYWFVERKLSTGGLPTKFNWRPRFHPTSRLNPEIVIVHYPGEPKVWDLQKSSIKGLEL